MSFTFKLGCAVTPHNNFDMIWSESTIDVIRRKIWSVVFSAGLAIKKCLWSILQLQTMSENRIVFDLTSHTGLLLLLLAEFFRFYRPYVAGQFYGQAHGRICHMTTKILGWIDNQIIFNGDPRRALHAGESSAVNYMRLMNFSAKVTVRTVK